MELKDCAFPTVHSIVATDSPDKAFENVDYALLVGTTFFFFFPSRFLVILFFSFIL